MNTLTNLDKIKIVSLLKSANLSSSNYSSTDKPFFMRDNNNKIKLDTNNLSINSKLPNKLNRHILYIYSLINDESKEIYIKNWTFFNLKKSLQIYSDFCKNNQKNVFDIAFKYEGLGHITVLSCDLETSLLFYRPDGGSNGLDREINYKNVIKNGSNEYKKIYFSDWINSL